VEAAPGSFFLTASINLEPWKLKFPNLMIFLDREQRPPFLQAVYLLISP
jgi:hypothetical protein